MQDLNDLYYFAQVVAHGGFAPAGRALNVPKSKLSRRIAQLEERLNARLIERSSRRFRVTEIGQAFHEQAQAAVAAADRAQALVAASLTEPRGQVNFSCPTGLVELIAPMLPDFLSRHPRVQVRLLAVDRPVDLIAESVDVALRVRIKLETDAALTMRTLARSRRILVASPAVANRLTSSAITALADLPTLSTSDQLGETSWILEGPGGVLHTLSHKPRLACGSFQAVRDAAIADLGVALLPDHACAEALGAGRLVRILPEWAGQDGVVHLVFTTRTGLPPHVRAWIDHLALWFKDPTLFAPVLPGG